MEILIRPSPHGETLGTHERFIGFLIEHYAGNFPLWRAPDQVRVDSDFNATPFKVTISNAE
jgi:hypothetical protein